MSVKAIAVASGHGANLPNSSSPFMNVLTEAHRLCNRVVLEIQALGSTAFGPRFDDISTTIKAGEEAVAAWCQTQARDVDLLLGFTTGGNQAGCEVWYLNQDALAQNLVNCLAEAGSLVNRGNIRKVQDDFLKSRTDKPGVVVSVCCSNVQSDVQRYQDSFDSICKAIARGICSLPEEWPAGG